MEKVGAGINSTLKKDGRKKEGGMRDKFNSQGRGRYKFDGG